MLLALQLVRVLRVLFKSQLHGWPDQSFWEWYRLFPRIFHEKPSPCAYYRIWPIWLDSFVLKFSFWQEWFGQSVLTNYKHPAGSFSEQVTHWPGTEQTSKILQSVHFLWLFFPDEFLAAMFLPKWHSHHILLTS